MVESAASCQRNTFSEHKVNIKCNTNITYSVDGVMLRLKIDIGKKQVSLDVSIIIRAALSALNLSPFNDLHCHFQKQHQLLLLIVMTPSCLPAWNRILELSYFGNIMVCHQMHYFYLDI